jgi:hypothetical protein
VPFSAEISEDGDGTLFRGMMIKDYPTLVRLKKQGPALSFVRPPRETHSGFSNEI